MLMDLVANLSQFGVAGLMGALWVWERRLSRKRETQLNETHTKLMRQHHELRMLVTMVRHNTRAIERFEQTQKQLRELLEKINHEMPRRAA